MASSEGGSPRSGTRYLVSQLLPGERSSGADLGDDRGLPVPDLVVGDLDDDPARSSQTLEADPVTLAIEEPAVEECALHLDDHAKATVDEVDPPDPAVVVTDVDLTLERRLSRPLDDLLEPSLEVAVGRPIARRPGCGEPPQGTRA